MANNLYNSMQRQNINPFQQLINDARQLQKSFQGNPKDEVQKLLNSGQMSQAQFNHYSQIAQQISHMMGNN